MVLLLLALACTRGPEERLEARHEATAPEMERHDSEAAMMRDALVAGRSEELRSAARVLRSRLPLGPDLPPLAQPFEAALALALDRVLRAEDLPGMADGVGAMAQACGDCHTVLGLSVQLASVPVPPVADPLQQQMQAHRSAAVELWAGVVTADGERVQAGAAALEASTLVPSGTAADAPVPPDAAALEVRVHDLAGQAARAEPAHRGRYLGEMLGTCAQCHLLLDSGPAGRAAAEVP